MLAGLEKRGKYGRYMSLDLISLFRTTSLLLDEHMTWPWNLRRKCVWSIHCFLIQAAPTKLNGNPSVNPSCPSWPWISFLTFWMPFRSPVSNTHTWSIYHLYCTLLLEVDKLWVLPFCNVYRHLDLSTPPQLQWCKPEDRNLDQDMKLLNI